MSSIVPRRVSTGVHSNLSWRTFVYRSGRWPQVGPDSIRHRLTIPIPFSKERFFSKVCPIEVVELFKAGNWRCHSKETFPVGWRATHSKSILSRVKRPFSNFRSIVLVYTRVRPGGQFWKSNCPVRRTFAKKKLSWLEKKIVLLDGLFFRAQKRLWIA